MSVKEIIKKQKKTSDSSDSDSKKHLILMNDDFNTFDFVINSLMDVCNHSANQAEQCAMITHYKGSCKIKKGSLNKLKPMKEGLIDRGLTVIIE